MLHRDGHWSLWELENSKIIIHKKLSKNPAIFMDLDYFRRYLLICFKKKIITIDCKNLNNIVSFNINTTDSFKKAKFCNTTNDILALNNKKILFHLTQQIKKAKMSIKMKKFMLSNFNVTISEESFISTINPDNTLKVNKK